MKTNLPNRIFYLFLLLSLIIIHFALSGCGNNENAESKVDKESARIDGSESLPYVAIYSRLTYEKFQEIREDAYPISHISIVYGKWGNYDQYDRPQEVTQLFMRSFLGKIAGDPFTFFIDYEGHYSYDLLDIMPAISESMNHTFSANEVNTIFDYLEEDDNEDYFFNGLEFTGLTQPYESPGIHFDYQEGSNQYITISFRESDTTYNQWAISKSMDTENPNTILAGLIDILENDFISQFE